MAARPIDPDFDSADPREAAEVRRLEWDVVLAVALGGVAGAEARYGLGVLAPHTPREFPWMTVFINVLGCLLIGVLIGLLQRSSNPPRLARPLLGTGVLGGFTTFSTFAVDVDSLVHEGCWGLAVGYLVTTIVLCLAAVSLALWAVGRIEPRTPSEPTR